MALSAKRASGTVHLRRQPWIESGVVREEEHVADTEAQNLPNLEAAGELELSSAVGGRRVQMLLVDDLAQSGAALVSPVGELCLLRGVEPGESERPEEGRAALRPVPS